MWALVDSNNVVVNKIVYDPEKPYTPPAGLVLREINRWVDIGMNADIQEADIPKPIPPIPETDRKSERDAKYKNDLSMVALYDAAKKTNPDLTFSQYLDSLEQMKSSITIDVEVGS